MQYPGSRGPAILGVTWLFTSIATIIVALRFYVRQKYNRALYVEDWIMLIALIFQLAAQSVLSRGYQFGLGSHDADLSLPEIEIIIFYDWVYTTPAILASITARISVCILMVKLFGVKIIFKWFTYTVTVLGCLVASLEIIFIWAQCKPVNALWMPQLILMGEATCWSPTVQQYTAFLGQSIFSFSDLFLVLFPVIIVWKLNMPLKKKLGLAVVLSLSVFTAVASILKTVSAVSPANAHDAQYHASMGLLWAATEQAFVIIIGSIPSLMAIGKIDFPLLSKWASSFTSLIKGSSVRSSQRETFEASDKTITGPNSHEEKLDAYGIKGDSSDAHAFEMGSIGGNTKRDQLESHNAV